MNKPTKEEMLDWLRFKSEGFDDDDPEYKAIRALIEKYGGGGPDDKFIRHIQDHLQPGDEVICKICGKTAKEIMGDGK